MTDFHKLFMVKTNKMIRKKTETSLSVVYVIYGSIVESLFHQLWATW